MNYATQNLEDDHIHILRLIEVMELMTQSSEPDVEQFEEAIDLIRNFADGMHHAKEESQLFPLLAERGFSLHQGPVAMMLHEHTLGRNFVKGMSENTGLLKNGDLSALNLIYSNISGYSELLRNHIARENNVLFRMADNVLSDFDQQLLFEQFERIDHQNTPNDKYRFIERIYRLAEVCNVK